MILVFLNFLFRMPSRVICTSMRLDLRVENFILSLTHMVLRLSFVRVQLQLFMMTRRMYGRIQHGLREEIMLSTRILHLQYMKYIWVHL